MKISKYLSASLFATMVLSLCLGFASCSDDKDDEEGPVTPKVKMVPTKVVEVQDDEDGTTTREYEYSYNNKLQISTSSILYVLSTETEAKPSKYAFEYDEKGRLKSRADLQDKGSKIEYTFVYDEKASTVTIKRDNNPDNYDIEHIDDKGYEKSYEVKTEGELEKMVIAYDKYRNVTSAEWTEITAGEDQNGKPTTDTEISVASIKYAQAYCPFVAVTSPKWAMSWLESPNSMESYFVGSNTPEIAAQKTTYITKDKDGKEISKSFDETTTTYKVVESKDNYPTKIIITKVDKEDGESTTTTTTLTITYKEVK